jgi:hypothetical protein
LESQVEERKFEKGVWEERELENELTQGNGVLNTDLVDMAGTRVV